MATIAPWKVHGDGRKVGPTEVVAPDERLAWPQTLGLGAQHVLAISGATFPVPLMKYLSRYGLFHDGQPAEPLTPAMAPATHETIERRHTPGAAV
jgi:hypothetical protein